LKGVFNIFSSVGFYYIFLLYLGTMSDFILNNADISFNKALKKGRIFSLNRKHCSIPALDKIVQYVPPESESYLGTRDIPVEKIIGTENRSHDFSLNFYPRKTFNKNRWMKVYQLFSTDQMHESIKVIKYGGYFFVRDGNHRVSVAKTLGIEFLTADIVEHKVSVDLPVNFDHGKLDLFKEKYLLNNRTGLFNYLDENDFDVRCSETWKMLEKEIFCYNKSWYIRQYKREPEDIDLVTNWNRSLYINIMGHIRNHSLLYLFPRMGLTDIFIEFIKYWNSFDDPDQFWVEEAYNNFTKQIRKRKFYFALIQTFMSKWGSLTRSVDEDKTHLELLTQINECKSDFSIPPDLSKSFYRFLHRQIIFHHALLLKKKIGRPPYMEELISDWYENFYSIILDQYNREESKMSFPRFYMKSSKKYHGKIDFLKNTGRNITFP